MRSQSGGPGQPFDCLGRRGVKYGAGEEGRGAGRREREREGGRDGGMKEGWRSQSILADGFHCPPHCSVSFQPHPFGEPYSRTHPAILLQIWHTHTHALRAGQPLSLLGHEGSCVALKNLMEESWWWYLKQSWVTQKHEVARDFQVKICDIRAECVNTAGF